MLLIEPFYCFVFSFSSGAVLVSARNTSDATALHLAAENNLASICSILLSNEIDFAAVDNRGNNAFHLAVKEGHLQVVRTLLTESQIDAEAINNKGSRILSLT